MKMTELQHVYDDLVTKLLRQGDEVPMQQWQSMDISAKPGMSYSRELRHETLRMAIPPGPYELMDMIQPNIPWAEDHFQERVGGLPLNPPPSERWWPYAIANNQAHKEGEKFSHTYPERIWPKQAGYPSGDFLLSDAYRHTGIRYAYGDLRDVIELLVRDPLTRQAYLPIWFPEDTGSISNQRVPCTLGYHFLLRNGALDIVYYIRSCDLFRHFRDDVYMAGRLLQWVVEECHKQGVESVPGELVMHISSLHVFEGDEARLKLLARKPQEEEVYGAAV